MTREDTGGPGERRTAAAPGDLGPRALRRLSDALPHMAWSATGDGRPDYYNAQWYGFTGLARGTRDEAAWRAVVHPDDQPALAEAWSRSVASGTAYELEYRLRRADGSWRWVLARALPVRDEAGAVVRWVGTCTDIDDARRAAELNRLLSHELGHRIKNLFSVVDGLIQHSAKSRPQLAPVAADLRERIGALARAHDYIRPRENDGGDRSLQEVLAQILRPYPAYDQGRIKIGGDDVAIAVAAGTPLALAVHELATNAAKYGALVGETGMLNLTVHSDGETVVLTWSEQSPDFTGAPPGAEGFGTGMIDLAIGRQLGGSVVREWRATGLQATLSLPAARLQRP